MAPIALPRACRILIIHNPTAGRKRQRFLRAVCAGLAAGKAEVVLRATEYRGHAREIAAGVTRAQWDVLAIAGGDGTINEVINGIGADVPTIGIIPMGTANVLAAEIGLPAKAECVAATILEGSPIAVRLGRANRHRFIMMAGIGFDARVVGRVGPGLKRWLGRGAYVVAAIREAVSGRRPRLAVRIDGTNRDCASVVIARGRHYAGRHLLAPTADLSRSSFVVCLFAEDGPLDILRYALALGRGRLHRSPGVSLVEAVEIGVAGAAGESAICILGPNSSNRHGPRTNRS